MTRIVRPLAMSTMHENADAALAPSFVDDGTTRLPPLDDTPGIRTERADEESPSHSLVGMANDPPDKPDENRTSGAPDIQDYQLRRTGDRPLAFRGCVVGEAAGVRINGRDRDRSHDLRVYRTVGGTHIVEIVYWTTWAGESEFRTVIAAGAEPARVAEVLRKHDPLAHVLGYPPADRFRSKQERLMARLREDFATRVSDVLVGLSSVEHIK